MNIPRYTCGLASDTGPSRPSNQDAASTILLSSASDFGRLDMGLFMVADGMGASEDGQKAAQIAIDMLTEEITSRIFEPLLKSGKNDINITVSSILTAAVQKANARVLKLPPKSGAGATLTAALLIGELLYIAHVGDSRAYHFARNQITQLTEDHHLTNVEPSTIALGPHTFESPIPHLLYRALGQSENLEVDIIVEHFQKSSHLLLCTDGLIGWDWDHVTEAGLQTVLRHSDPQTACNLLIAMAIERGSQDNVTALVVKAGGE